MCEWKSGVAVLLSENEVQTYTLPLIDSHRVIREKFNIKENGLFGLCGKSTPIELIPKAFPPKSFKAKDWTFRFDDSRPCWWTDSMTEQATRQLLKAAKSDLKNNNEKEQLAAVRQDGWAIAHIVKPSAAVKMAAVQSYGSSIRYIKRATEAMKLAAVKNNGTAIKYIQSPSEAVQKAAVRQDYVALAYIKNPSAAVKRVADEYHL